MPRDRNLDLRGLDAWITREPREYGEPPRIPVSGADARDIERSSAAIVCATDLFRSVVHENAKIYEAAVSAIIANHHENVPITKTVRPTAFPSLLADLLDDFLRGLNDLRSDTQGDIERALDE
jgi:hypothetical protein